MIVRTLSKLTRRLFIALAVGSAAAPAIALAASPAPTAVAAVLSGATQAALPAQKVVAGAIALGIDKREAVGQAGAFQPSVGAVYAWVKVRNMAPEATTITMVWKKDGHKKLSVTLPVGHSWGWKTWSKKGITEKDIGHWTVEVLDAKEQLLDTLAFDVDASAAPVTVGAVEK
ncbi:MAG: DUF2914 domain-containing protein [Myxococcota bacterium]